MNDRQANTACPAEEVLSAHLDGDLEPAEQRAIEAHLADCAACRQAVEALGALAGDLRALAPQAPPADLWPAIAAQHRAEREGGWIAALRRWWMLPATALAGAALALLVVFLVGGQPEGPAPGTKGPLTALDAVLQAEQIYAQSITDMEQAMGREKAHYSPEVQETIAGGLAEVDRAIEKCRQTLRQHPQDLKAHEAMLAAYQHKVDFMTELLGERL